jgi:hypothetical protein
MPTESGKPLIVISYAHEDEPERPAEGEVKWLSFVTGYLRPAIKHGAFELWLDRMMPGGADWEREIEQKLRACDIFILLVSRHSLSSDYVVDKEIAIIRERQARGDEVHFYPLVLTPTPTIALDLVRSKNLRPRDGMPLSDYPLHERYRHMTGAADEIAEIAVDIVDRERRASLSTPPSKASEETRETQARIVDRESLEGWLEGQSVEVAVTLAARAALRALPLAVRLSLKRPSTKEFEKTSVLISALFRAAALARVVGRYATRIEELRAAVKSAGARASEFAGAATVAQSTAAYTPAARATADAYSAYAAAAESAAGAVRAAAIRGPGTASVAAQAAAEATTASDTWGDMRCDISSAIALGAQGLADSPVWPCGLPPWAEESWIDLGTALPKDEDWQVWIDWYDERVRGGSRGEEYELVFASVPQEKWDTGPAAANAWIKANLPPRGNAPGQWPEDEVEDGAALSSWLGAQNREVAVSIAGRTALRVAPLIVHALQGLPGPDLEQNLRQMTCAVFRAAALARVAVKYPEYAAGLHDSAQRASAVASATYKIAGHSAIAYGAINAAMASANTIFAVANSNAGVAAEASHAATVGLSGTQFIWEEIRADAFALKDLRFSAALDLPIWLRAKPQWATVAWADLQSLLPHGEDWEVWIEWYDDRLRGGSRGEAHELVFAEVPQGEWDKGPAAANAWIKAHLPKSRAAAQPAGLPAPLPNLHAPFAYGWTPLFRVAAVAGAQNLPYYPNFKSEEDHRRGLEACRVGGERLLKALRNGRYNARPEYGEALEYYLDDLPKTAGAGNILLANDQARILHDMFLADAAMLPEGFASRLRSVIANQFALNAFYDLVQRHNEAVEAGNWSQPFPLEAAKNFFGAVEDNTPRWFERDVEQGLRQVEQAEPPPAVAPSEPALAPPSALIEPPPLPPGTPDAQDSWKRQMATAANALWETFLQGQSMPVDKDEWRQAAEELGAHVRPIIDFLRAQEEGKK